MSSLGNGLDSTNATTAHLLISQNLCSVQFKEASLPAFGIIVQAEITA